MCQYMFFMSRAMNKEPKHSARSTQAAVSDQKLNGLMNRFRQLRSTTSEVVEESCSGTVNAWDKKTLPEASSKTSLVQHIKQEILAQRSHSGE